MTTPIDSITNFIFVQTKIECSDVILIPGGSHPQLMEEAVRLYQRGLAPYILPSGGRNKNIPAYASNWLFLNEIGLSLGVPEEAILKEDQARNTFDNAELSLKVLTNSGINVKKAILVCKAWHSRRALLTYQYIFPRDTRFMVSPVTDKRGITKENWFLNEESIKLVMGEVRKIGHYFEDKVHQMTRE